MLQALIKNKRREDRSAFWLKKRKTRESNPNQGLIDAFRNSGMWNLGNQNTLLGGLGGDIRYAQLAQSAQPMWTTAVSSTAVNL